MQKKSLCIHYYTDSVVLGSWLAGQLAERLWRLRPGATQNKIIKRTIAARRIGKRRWRQNRRWCQNSRRLCKSRAEDSPIVQCTRILFSEISLEAGASEEDEIESNKYPERNSQPAAVFEATAAVHPAPGAAPCLGFRPPARHLSARAVVSASI